MASRPAFLKREPGLARPRPNPASRPPTRRPPKGDPRSPQWRPAPKPKPNPKFTPPKRNPIPFGRRPAITPPSPLGPLRRAPLGALARMFPRILPGVGWALAAYDLWELYQWYQQQGDAANFATSGVCVPETAFINPQYPTDRWGWRGQAACGPNPGPGMGLPTTIPPYNPEYPYLFLHHLAFQSTQEIQDHRWWYFPDGWNGVDPSLNPEPKIVPMPPGAPNDNPYPYPFAPAPLPVKQPFTRPNQEPGYQPEPKPAPLVRPLAPPVGLTAPVPVISWSPGELPQTDWHERRPPYEHEAEKKKRLKPGTSAAWLSFMDKAVGSYTEVDDTISALYKGLPWKLRRWRGKDGVWRDRDIRSDTRAKRLYELLGKLDVEKAIEEVIKQQLTDAAFGTVGNKLKRRAKELGDEGLWSGNTGFQQGGANRQDTWDEAYEKLKKEAASKVKTRQYTVKIRVGPGLYRFETRTRPVTQIPWFKQQSLYPRMARPGMAEWWTLTAAEKAARKKNVKAYYYAATRSPRP